MTIVRLRGLFAERHNYYALQLASDSGAAALSGSTAASLTGSWAWWHLPTHEAVSTPSLAFTTLDTGQSLLPLPHSKVLRLASTRPQSLQSRVFLHTPSEPVLQWLHQPHLRHLHTFSAAVV